MDFLRIKRCPRLINVEKVLLLLDGGEVLYELASINRCCRGLRKLNMMSVRTIFYVQKKEKRRKKYYTYNMLQKCLQEVQDFIYIRERKGKKKTLIVQHDEFINFVDIIMV